MRRLIFVVALVLGGCSSQVGGGINWTDAAKILKENGRLRTERAPRDAPVSPQLLQRNFEKIAFHFEKTTLNNRQARGPGARPMIRKWVKPIGYTLVTAEADDRAFRQRTEAFIDRLIEITGHPIRPYQNEGDGSDRLLIIYGPDTLMQELANAERANRLEWIRNKPGADAWLSEVISRWRFRRSPCGGRLRLGSGRGKLRIGEIKFAMIVIRQEIPEALLDVCIEEELAQVLGLINDDRTVRPSIFNDDQEFALLTDHDAELLRALYDPRIKPGMSPAQAMPIVREILGAPPAEE